MRIAATQESGRMSNEADLRDYFKRVESACKVGSATEHTYRPYLKKLLEQLVPDMTAINGPKSVCKE
jgi:hypothetical protein